MRLKLLILWYLAGFKLNRLRYSGRPASLRRKRWRQLRRTLAESPYYAAIDGRELEDFPVIDKGEFMHRFDVINTLGIPRSVAEPVAERAERERDFTPTIDGVSVGLSSGTSGNRGIFMTTTHERARWVAAILDRVIGWSWRPRRAAFFLRANNNLYAAAGSRLLQFRFFDLLEPTERHLPRLNDFRPDILIGQPSLLLALAAAVERQELSIGPQKIISVAEVLTPEDRAYLERVFALRLDEVYQCTEGFLAASCSEGNLHFNEDFLIVERKYLDESRTRFHPVITDLLRTSQPVIRYELNDIITVPDGPCPCGGPHQVIASIEGRSDDVLRFRDRQGVERAVFPDHFRRAIIGAHPGIRNYELVARGLQHLELFVAGTEQYRRAVIALYGFLASQGIVDVTISRLSTGPRPAGQKLRRIRNEYR